MPDATRLDNQVAIVTGAARGIGRGIALVLAEAGASIVIGDLLDSSETVRLVEDLGGKAVSMQMDTSRPEDAQALVDLALNTFGRLDILVNDAGIDAPDGNVWDLPDEGWTRVIDVNLSGVFYCSKAALQPMLKAGQGAIVNISSQSARIGSQGMSPAYNTSKAGVLGPDHGLLRPGGRQGCAGQCRDPRPGAFQGVWLVERRGRGEDRRVPAGSRRTQGHRRGGQISGQPRVSMGLGDCICTSRAGTKKDRAGSSRSTQLRKSHHENALP